MSQFAIAIPTYQRPGLLRLLIEDIARQSLLPERVIVIDGDPKSKAVIAILNSLQQELPFPVACIPSNHGNLAYQRYLGWRCASGFDPEFLVYFDDDIRLKDQNTLSELLAGFEDAAVVGATARTVTGGLEKFSNEPALMDMRTAAKSNWLVNVLGTARKYPPGGYTPVGNRIFPDTGEPISRVEWLQGRVMAYRMSALDPSCFLEDLFALTHIRCGLGEDSILSRQVGRKGKLILFQNLNIEHPDDAMPNSYPTRAYQLGYATAYSRRFLNDHYRVVEPPHFSDRVDLLKSYLGNNLINLARALARPRRHRFAYAWGYFVGSLRGVLQKPTARSLAPGIDWWQDAEAALAGQVVLS